uniref:Pco142704 n=1 Tax=Arundo donax TaxID=35708 RepID=A0A0A9EAR5_ARUDO
MNGSQLERGFGIGEFFQEMKHCGGSQYRQHKGLLRWLK